MTWFEKKLDPRQWRGEKEPLPTSPKPLPRMESLPPQKSPPKPSGIPIQDIPPTPIPPLLPQIYRPDQHVARLERKVRKLRARAELDKLREARNERVRAT